MRRRHARRIRHGIALFRLNWPRFSAIGGAPREPFLTYRTWLMLEQAAREGTTHGRRR